LHNPQGLAGKNPPAAYSGRYNCKNHEIHALDRTTGLMNTGSTHRIFSLLLPENLGNREIATEKNSKAPEGATAGVRTGAMLDGALGLLASIGALGILGESADRGRTDHGDAGPVRRRRSGLRLCRVADRRGNSGN